LCSQPSRRYCPTKIQHPRHLAINGTNADATLDQYATTDSYATNDYGGFTFPTASKDSFKFTVTAKNASSSGYTVSFADLTLTPHTG